MLTCLRYSRTPIHKIALAFFAPRQFSMLSYLTSSKRSVTHSTQSHDTPKSACTLQAKASMQIEQLMSQTMHDIEEKNHNEAEFLQTVREVFFSLKPLFHLKPELVKVFRILAEPERIIVFRVPWIDRNGTQCFNRGFRVQHSSALGPYKGGLRFHPSVTQSVMKFLAFEQTLKNALTGIAMGGAKGGSDFNPKGKTDAEIMSFCQSLMTELYKHIGPNTDVPAGDINVGMKEIGYMYGQYKRLTNRFDGAMTAKGILWGGSHIRPEATGYGTVFFAQEWCHDNNIKLKGARCAISGSGNVALYAGKKLCALGAKPITFSDSAGTIYEPDGFDDDRLQHLMHLKLVLKKRVKDYCSVSPTAKYFHKMQPWNVSTDITLAFPCATQNELGIQDARSLIQAGCRAVIEGANMPTTPEALSVLKAHQITVAPGKAANAGGVAVSGLEMAQNSMRTTWTATQVEEKLQHIMTTIYQDIKDVIHQYTKDPTDLISGANINGFLKVANALMEQGCV